MVHLGMIRTVRHRGLRRLIDNNDRSGLSAQHLHRIMDIVAHLNIATRPNDLDMPGFRLHGLKGTYKGFWSVRVSGNLRLIFRMEDGNVYDVDLVDYH